MMRTNDITDLIYNLRDIRQYWFGVETPIISELISQADYTLSRVGDFIDYVKGSCVREVIDELDKEMLEYCRAYSELISVDQKFDVSEEADKETLFRILHSIVEWSEWIKKLSGFYNQDTPERAKTDRDIRSCLLVQDDKKDDLLKELHLLIDGQKGKFVAIVIHVCVEMGLMGKPTFGVLKAEFGNIGNPSGFNNQYKRIKETQDRKSWKTEIDGIKSHFITFLEKI